ncbi:MAG TPA: alpha/beta hydrolase [Usitatibacter sp.]|nr:alpha/beta hydrolase [Usitatibacter sp.]
MKRFLLFAAACWVLAACHPVDRAPRPALALEECRLPGVDGTASCGTFDVWEDRSAKKGRRIGINVAVVPARIRAHEPDPIFVFAGGPGQGAVALASDVMPLFSRLNDLRDIVFIDQRGTGSSHPLDCDEDQDSPLQSVFEDALPEDLVKKCLAQMDADPRQYVTSIAVEDIDDVRAALGYDKVNLWGGSYGTRVELEYLRRHGEHVRSMVLDGVAPATMKLPLSFVADGDAALAKLVSDCAADALCRLTYPDLRGTIESLRSRLARRPVRAAIQDPRTGERETIDVTENVFLSGLFRPLYVAELASLLPFGIASAARGDFNPLLAQNLEFADDVSENLSLGMHLAVVCSEDIPLVTPADLADADRSFFGRALVNDFVRACRDWPKGRVPADYYTPVTSSVPALVLSGGIDPATPPRHAQKVVATLPNARHFIAPHLGHGVSLHGCAPHLVEEFIRKGSAATLDGSCLAKIPRPLYMLPLGAPS